MIYITTGFQLNGPLVDMVEAGKDTLNGIIEDEHFFLASLDDEDDINDSETGLKLIQTLVCRLILKL